MCETPYKSKTLDKNLNVLYEWKFGSALQGKVTSVGRENGNFAQKIGGNIDKAISFPIDAEPTYMPRQIHTSITNEMICLGRYHCIYISQRAREDTNEETCFY